MERDYLNTYCNICTAKCIVRAEVTEGKLTGIKPPAEPELAKACHLCLRGVHGADYAYRPDRLSVPLRRIGARGEGKFEEITWDEALDTIAEKLLQTKANFGADAVCFFSGYNKWYRPMLRRLCASFGSVNYGTESSSCHRATVLAQRCDSGYKSVADYQNAKLILTFARGSFPKPMKDAHDRGAGILAIDPRCSRDILRYADLHLRPRPGTDAALAAGIANALIARGAIDADYIRQYVYGYAEYAAYVSDFSPERTEELTGVPAAQVLAAAELIADNLPFTVFDGFTGAIHHRGGVDIFRAWFALSAITGSYGVPGGVRPVGPLLENGHPPCAYRELAFSHPKDNAGTVIGGDRFPVWAELLDECQCMDWPAAQHRGELKAIFALGLNARMFPDSSGIFEVLQQLDFFADCDLWMSDTAKYADIVLPVCSSYERSGLLHIEKNNTLWYTRAAIAPFGQSRGDDEIVVDLARRIAPQDTLLCTGREACWRWQLEGCGITLEELEQRAAPYSVPSFPAPDIRRDGFNTPTGKFELFSTRLAARPGLHPLPVYTDPLAGQDTKHYPLILQAGVRTDRYAYAIHSRTHTVPALRAYRGEAAVDLHPQDAAALGIEKGDRVRLETQFGSISVRADLDDSLLPGTVNMFHGYGEADVNSLIPGDYLDPCSGFPGYKAIACRVTKEASKEG